MTGKCADAVADWLIGCGIVKETDKELYSYAVYSILLSLSPIMLAVGLGLFMGCVRQSIMIIIPFVAIRKFSGGYHTKHPWSCFICSCLLLTLCIVLSFHVSCGWALAAATAGAAIGLICFSPIDSENRRLSQEECRHCKKITSVLVIIFMLAGIIFFVCRMYKYAVCISIGIILSAGLQLPCIPRKLKKLNQDDQNEQKNVVSCKMD